MTTTPKVKIKQINKNKFYLTFWNNGKRIKRFTFNGSKSEAELAAAHYQSEMLSDRFEFLQKQQILSVSDLINEFLSYKKTEIRPASIHRYKNHLDAFQKYLSVYFPEAYKDINLIKPVYILEAFDYFKENKKWRPETLNGGRQCVGAIFRYAVNEKYLTDNPIKKLNKFKIDDEGKVKFYSHDELTHIIENIDTFWRDFIEFLYLTGLRKSELINLTWDNVDLTKNAEQITIASNDKWKTKSGKSRIVPLHKKAVPIIKRCKGKNKNYVFTDKKNGKIHPDKPYHALKKALEHLGLEGDLHKLRHTFAAHLVMKGVNIYDVSKLLGHSDIKTTEIYAHLTPNHLKKVVDIL